VSFVPVHTETAVGTTRSKGFALPYSGNKSPLRAFSISAITSLAVLPFRINALVTVLATASNNHVIDLFHPSSVSETLLVRIEEARAPSRDTRERM